MVTMRSNVHSLTNIGKQHTQQNRHSNERACLSKKGMS